MNVISRASRSKPLARAFSLFSNQVEVNMIAAATGDSMRNAVASVKGKDSEWVVSSTGFGPWSKSAKVDSKHLHKIDSGVPVEYAAVALEPLKAVRLLQDFQKLKAGDLLIHYGAESLSGQALVQLAKAKGIITVSIVRNVSQADEISHVLKALGSDIVLPEWLACSWRFQRLLSDLPKASLVVVNGFGEDVSAISSRFSGKTSPSALKALKDTVSESEWRKVKLYNAIRAQLKEGGKFVTYDVKGNAPVTKDGVKHEIFNLSDWIEKNDPSADLTKISSLFKEDELHLWLESFDFSELEHAKNVQEVGFRHTLVKF